mgnify:FL=1
METLRLDDFTKYKFLSEIKHSPSGHLACFAVHEADWEKNGYRSYLWLCNLESGECFQLTGFGEERSFTWLNDEEILFSALRSPKDQEAEER